MMAKKRYTYLFLDRHVKSEKRACAVVYVHSMNGKLAKKKTLLWILFFLVLQPKKHHLDSCAKKKITPAQAYKCIFRPENGC